MRGEKRQLRPRLSLPAGSPPHARGKDISNISREPSLWITPACAGKSVRDRAFYRPVKDHPRMRGEKAFRKAFNSIRLGSPPHARGKGSCMLRRSAARRITPACAGKRNALHGCNPCAEDHPRMRGEKREKWKHRSRYPGSPPHARGKVKPGF